MGETRILAEDPNAPLADAPLLRPPVNGLGVTAASAGAITDLAGGRELVGRDAIDAVRIGVAGLEGYNAEGREKVAQVAEALQDLGFNVNVVAGSSREQTLVYVPGYFVERNQPSEDLGWVSQEWSTLGAAQRVEAGLGQGALTLLLLALGSTSLLAMTGLAFEGLARRPEVAVLHAQGWERRHIRGWLLGELGTGAAVLAAAVGVAWLVQSRAGGPPGALAAASAAGAEAGESRLGHLMTGSLLPLYLALAAVGVVAAVAIVWVGRRVLALVRNRAAHALTVAGWSPRQVRGLWDREAIAVGALTLVVGGALAALLATLAQVPTLPPVLAAVGAAILATLAGNRRSTP